MLFDFRALSVRETVSSGVLERCWKVVQSSFQLIPSDSQAAFWADTCKKAIGGNPMGISGFAYWNPPVSIFFRYAVLNEKVDCMTWGEMSSSLPLTPSWFNNKGFRKYCASVSCAGWFSIDRRLIYSSKKRCFKIGNPKLVRWICGFGLQGQHTFTSLVLLLLLWWRKTWWELHLHQIYLNLPVEASQNPHFGWKI